MRDTCRRVPRVEGRDGRLYVVTDHPKNDFVVFGKDGTFVHATFGDVAGSGLD